MGEDRLIDLYFDAERRSEVDEKYPGLRGLLQMGEWLAYLFLSSVIRGDNKILEDYGVGPPETISEDEYPFLTLQLAGMVYESYDLSGGMPPETHKEMWAQMAAAAQANADLFEEISKGYFHFAGDVKD